MAEEARRVIDELKATCGKGKDGHQRQAVLQEGLAGGEALAVDRAVPVRRVYGRVLS